MPKPSQFDAVVIGAGFAGLYALYKLRSLGLKVKVYEAGSGLGGTWYWNRYPGARCDVHSLEYSFQFSEALQQEWIWSEKYAPQAEILEYANHVADRFDLRKDIQFDTRISALTFDDASNLWIGKTQERETFSARYCIMATGCLSVHNVPDFAGMADFQGQLLHTGQWPHEPIEFHNQEVGIIGTGSSAIQAIPIIAEQAKQLTVFQRTASFSIPAHNAPMDQEYERNVKANYKEFRQHNSQRYAALNNNPSHVSALEVSEEERREIFEQRWQEGGLPFLASFNDLGTEQEANNTAVEFVHGKIKEIVKDQDTAELLCPKTVMGCKRLCVDTDYYKTFNRDNVSLVDLNTSPIQRITQNGIQTSDREYRFDALILATGFDAMTGALLAIDIRGVANKSLAEHWENGPANFLGLTMSGFPNMFMITGPGSPSVLANMIVGIEQHVDFIADLITFMQKNEKFRVEANSESEANWVKLVNSIADKTLFPTGCNSWYTGANIPGKPRIFMPYLGYPSYVEKCNEIAANDYRDFEFS
ncbi:MAG: NAD(P)/FAD-dependent oxidoreductase [Gammaproteobacteria bacterium]|nr:NAD(P)/FAD-dependent oxidoreductase [Gammaproteobacteria bacterium]